MSTADPGLRPVWAEVDLDAIRHNADVMAGLAAPASLCAVVKADAYGHGAVPVSRAALEGGAACLAVAFVHEGVELRDAGIEAPVLLLSEPDPAGLRVAIAHRLTPTLYTARGVAAAAAAAAAAGGGAPVGVHLKVDTGMHRVGASAGDLPALAAALGASGSLYLDGLWTHLAVAEAADAEGRAFTAEQLRALDEARGRLAESGLRPGVVHAANSAAAIAHPGSRYGMVRCGISLYGYLPVPALASSLPPGQSLRPALTLRARVALVRTLPAGERISYGRHYRLAGDSVVATVPVGYADGVPRRLSEVGAHVLVGGRRCPIAGTVTMDLLMADCGPASSVQPGDEVVLLGEQGREGIWADEWAGLTGTISYEVLTGIGRRVPRRHVGGHGGGVGATAERPGATAAGLPGTTPPGPGRPRSGARR